MSRKNVRNREENSKILWNHALRGGFLGLNLLPETEERWLLKYGGSFQWFRKLTNGRIWFYREQKDHETHPLRTHPTLFPCTLLLTFEMRLIEYWGDRRQPTSGESCTPFPLVTLQGLAGSKWKKVHTSFQEKGNHFSKRMKLEKDGVRILRTVTTTNTKC